MKLRTYRKVAIILLVLTITPLVGIMILGLGHIDYLMPLLYLSMCFLFPYLVCHFAYSRCPHCHSYLRHLGSYCRYCGGSLRDEPDEP